MSEAFMPTEWRCRGAWQAAGVPTGRFGYSGSEPQVHVVLHEQPGIATLIARSGQVDALSNAVSTLGVRLPMTPRVANGAGFDVIWSGREQWLAVGSAPLLARHLRTELGLFAAVSDQSHGRAVLRLSGPRARNTLAKGCLIDLHPRGFGVGDVALTSIAHIGAHIWQVDDTPSYDVAVFRSMAGSLWSWLSASAAEFGLEVVSERDRRSGERKFMNPMAGPA